MNINELQFTIDMHEQSFESTVELLKLFGKDISNINAITSVILSIDKELDK